MKKAAAGEAGGAPKEKAQRGVQSTEVGGRLLHALARAREPLALTDLAESAELAPAQAHTYLVSLTRLGLIKRDELSGRYEPGPLSLRLGLLHLEHQSAYRAAVPHATALAEALGCSVAICIAGPHGPTIVRYEHAGFPLHMNLHVGTVMSLTKTATGRVFCAFLPAERVQAMWATQATRTLDAFASADERDAFEATLAAIRKRGIERAVDTPSPGISSLSVPVLDAHGELGAALTVIGSSGAIDVGFNGAVARALRAASEAIGRELAAAS
ncbi:IclR family transcriptional regulator [Trinickia terrae]|uniref:IclR family transcriptional regulator n=1 Tax=Trinickia terrae TaxID=2571161 RepID=A0A4U1I3K7_9BURK|nr:IclR family transcriptional regulator [Trinickia terrae]TKC87831.1 IclR family transcriptional regulator [Trinickia terrae]